MALNDIGYKIANHTGDTIVYKKEVFKCNAYSTYEILEIDIKKRVVTKYHPNGTKQPLNFEEIIELGKSICAMKK